MSQTIELAVYDILEDGTFYGEIELTIAVLEQLDNIQERLLSPYLLYEAIAQAARDAAAASIPEVKLNFDLL